MDLIEFKQRYIRALPEVPEGLNLGLDEFHLFDPSAKGASLLNKEDYEHLVSVGLPVQAPPFLSFGDYLDWDYDADRYFPIGSDGAGNNICIDINTRDVVLLDHDWDMKRIFINSSLDKFAECLCVFQEAVRAESFDQCLGLMTGVDGKLVKSGDWWANEVEQS